MRGIGGLWAPRGSAAFVVVVAGVGVAAAVVPGDVGVGARVDGRLMGADGAVDEELDQVRAEHVPVVVVVLVAVITHDDEAPDAAVGEQRLVDGEVGQVFFDRQPLVLVQRDARLHAVQCGSGVARVVGERVRREAGWQVVTHPTTVADPGAVTPQASEGIQAIYGRRRGGGNTASRTRPRRTVHV